MSKQTRLNFSNSSSTSSKRRKLNTDDEPNEQIEEPVPQKKTQVPTTTGLNKTKRKTPATAQSDQENAQAPSDPQPTTSKSRVASNTQGHITLTYEQASLFDSPPSTVLCHATNAQGTWGAGIAAAFRKNYPAAFKIYAAHCAKWDSSSLLGTTFLIPPQRKSPTKSEREAEHWIACLFTSEKKGKGKGSKESILAATGEAIEDLVRKVKAVNEAADATDKKSKSDSDKEDGIAAVHMCKINSGLFGVPWEATSEVIEAVETGEGDIDEIAVISMD